MTAATRPRFRNGRDDPEADVDEIQRSYTPTSSEEDTGRVDIVLKVYKGGVVDRFPDGGKMSQYFGGLKVGDEVAISGDEVGPAGAASAGTTAPPAGERCGKNSSPISSAEGCASA